MKKLVNNFLYGETSQNMAGRLDTDVFSQGCAELENMIVQKQGGIRRRSPLKFLLDTSKYEVRRIIPFIPNTEQSYVILMGVSCMWFAKWTPDSTTPLTIMTTIDEKGETTDQKCIYADAIKEDFTELKSESIKLNAKYENVINSVDDDDFYGFKYAQYYNSLYIVNKNYPVMRVDLDGNVFKLVLPRLLVNQDVEFSLTQEAKDMGYTVSHELGWSNYEDLNLNNGKGNYPSVIAIINQRMWLANTINNPYKIWVSRPFGNSQIISDTDNHSIQDFLQFDIYEDDTQTLKDSADFPTTDMMDENGYPVMEYDSSTLLPIYRVARASNENDDSTSYGFEIKEHTEYLGTTGHKIYGLVDDGHLLAIKTDELDSNGFPVLINMSGDTLYNVIDEWSTGNIVDGKDEKIKYVKYICSDTSLTDVFARAKYDANGKPITADGTFDNNRFNTEQTFVLGNVRLYAKYAVDSTTSETYIQHLTTCRNSDSLTFTWKDLDGNDFAWKTRYAYTDGGKYSSGSLSGLYKWYPDKGALKNDSFAISCDSTTGGYFSGKKYSVTQSVPYNSTTPIPEDGKENSPYSYRTYTQKSFSQIDTYTVENCKYVDRTDTYMLNGSEKARENGWRIVDQPAYAFSWNVPDPHGDSLPSSPNEGDVFYLFKLWIWAFFYDQKVWEGQEQILSTSTITKTYDYISDEDLADNSTTSTRRNGTYTRYTRKSRSRAYTAMENIHTYGVEEQCYYSIFKNCAGGLNPIPDSIDSKEYISGSVSYTYNGQSYLYNASSSTQIRLTKSNENNTIYVFEQYNGTAWNKIFEISSDTIKDENDVSQTRFYISYPTDWDYTASTGDTFAIALTTTNDDELTPTYMNSKIYGYYLEQNKEQYISAICESQTDLSNPNALVLYDKALSKVDTSTTAMQFELATGKNDPVKWIAQLDKTIIGTSSGEFRIPEDANALDISQTKYSNYGSAYSYVGNINTDLIFVQKNNNVRLLYEDYYGTHDLDLSLTNETILKEGVYEIVVKQTPNPILFFLKKDGTVASLCLDRANKVQGWGRLTFGDQKIKSICKLDSELTQSLVALVEQTIGDRSYSYLCKFDEDVTGNEQYKDCGYELTAVSSNATYDESKTYFKSNLGGYVSTTDNDFDYIRASSTTERTDLVNGATFELEYDEDVYEVVEYNKTADEFTWVTGDDAGEEVDEETYTYPTDFYTKTKTFKSSITYYTVDMDNNALNYTSKMTTNPYDAVQQDGSVTLGDYKSVKKIIFRALDSGKIVAYFDSTNKNRTLYDVCKNKSGLGDFELNTVGASTSDLMVTVEAYEGEPLNLLAMAYDVRMNNGR